MTGQKMCSPKPGYQKTMKCIVNNHLDMTLRGQTTTTKVVKFMTQTGPNDSTVMAVSTISSYIYILSLNKIDLWPVHETTNQLYTKIHVGPKGCQKIMLGPSVRGQSNAWRYCG